MRIGSMESEVGSYSRLLNHLSPVFTLELGSSEEVVHPSNIRFGNYAYVSGVL